MDDQLDLAIALSLQEKFDKEAKTEHKKKLTKVQKEWDDTKVDPRSIMDSQLELTDPNPNIHELFVQYDAMFFWSKLVSNGVAVRWSPRMTLCAGVCAYEGRGGLCSIRLSQPLLKLRPRKDLVQTLLHEMIHAYLFVTENYRDHDGHGPKFLSHMNRINGMTGAHISVYHSFHDEVREYRQHWWKCNGPCQFRPPYFGIVKRAMNRAPSSRDPWWSQHKASCGGTYEKIKEPENYGKNKTKQQSSGKKKTVKSKNIKDMFDKKDVDGGSRKAGASVGDSSGVKPFEGSGHRLVDKDKTEVGGDKLSLREKMLLAAEKRHLEAQRRGSSSQSGVVHQKRPRDKISPPCSHHQSESISSDDLHPSVKRPKITSDNSVIVIDSDSPQATTKSFSTLNKADKYKSSINVGEPGPSSALLITDDGAEDVVALGSAPAHENSSESGDVIEVEDESLSSSASPEDLRTCPVCGVSNIPKAIINAHTVFCLDAEEESQTVDDEAL